MLGFDWFGSIFVYLVNLGSFDTYKGYIVALTEELLDKFLLLLCLNICH